MLPKNYSHVPTLFWTLPTSPIVLLCKYCPPLHCLNCRALHVPSVPSQFDLSGHTWTLLLMFGAILSCYAMDVTCKLIHFDSSRTGKKLYGLSSPTLTQKNQIANSHFQYIMTKLAINFPVLWIKERPCYDKMNGLHMSKNIHDMSGVIE